MSAKKSPKQKAPVVMIHGAFSGPWAWENFAARFRAEGYAVHLPCLRHHQGGKPPAELATPA